MRMTLRAGRQAVATLAALLAPALLAQEPAGTLPETKAPAPVKTAQTPPPVNDWERAHQEQLRTDWPWLAKYKEANLKLTAPAPGENRVVFMGDSITEAWHFEGPDGSFAGKPFINRGISGQTSPQMLIRFRPDVIGLQPKVVVILAGTNDIAGNTGPMTLEAIEGNLASMAELAKANGIRVVMASVMPVCDYIRPQTARRPPEKIRALNSWIKDYSAKNGLVYLDYYTAMLDDQQMLKKELTYDGLHPNDAGYELIGPLAEKAISAALR